MHVYTFLCFFCTAEYASHGIVACTKTNQKPMIISRTIDVTKRTVGKLPTWNHILIRPYCRIFLPGRLEDGRNWRCPATQINDITEQAPRQPIALSPMQSTLWVSSFPLIDNAKNWHVIKHPAGVRPTFTHPGIPSATSQSVWHPAGLTTLYSKKATGWWDFSL